MNINIQEMKNQYNAACEKHECFFGDLDNIKHDEGGILLYSEYYGIGITEVNGQFRFHGVSLDLDNEFYDLFFDEENEPSTFDSIDEVVESMKFYFTV